MTSAIPRELLSEREKLLPAEKKSRELLSGRKKFRAPAENFRAPPRESGDCITFSGLDRDPVTLDRTPVTRKCLDRATSRPVPLDWVLVPLDWVLVPLDWVLVPARKC